MIENRQSTWGRPPGAPEDLPHYVHPDEFIDPEERDPVTGEPIWVQNKRRAILKEQSENYTCLDCGVKLDKSQLADHAMDCRGNRKTLILENTAGLEIDYSKLKPGMKVQIKSWDKMVLEYGIKSARYICGNGFDIHYSKDDEEFVQKKNRIVKIKKIINKAFYIENKFCALPIQCIESIIQEKQPNSDLAKNGKT